MSLTWWWQEANATKITLWQDMTWTRKSVLRQVYLHSLSSLGLKAEDDDREEGKEEEAEEEE